MTSQDPSRIGREGSKSEASLCATWDSGVPAGRKTRGGLILTQVGGEAKAIPPRGRFPGRWGRRELAL